VHFLSRGALLFFYLIYRRVCGATKEFCDTTKIARQRKTALLSNNKKADRTIFLSTGLGELNAEETSAKKY
jgi:hypothetical protein